MVDLHAQVAVTAPVQTSSSKPPETTTNKNQTSPITTTQPSTNTTQLTTRAPSSTISHAPSNATTQPIPHTTTPVLPTRPSPPTNGHYVVNNTKGTCIIADMGLGLELENATTVKQDKETKVCLIWLYVYYNPA